jgi:superfamily II DNA/RNA helicase
VTDMAIQAIVVTPCREIAVQIAHVIKSIGAFKTGKKKNNSVHK